MGCFNVRCSYSGTEINADDDVVIFFLKNNAFGDGMRGYRCDPHDAYSLLGPGIPAKYNEYGWYEFNEELTVAKIMQEVITKNWEDTEVGNKRYRGDSKREIELIRKEREDDVPKEDRSLFTWKTIGDMIHDGDYDLTNPMTRYGDNAKIETYLHVMAVHADHYHDFLASDLQYGWGSNKVSYVDIIGEAWDKVHNKTGVDKKAVKAIFDKQEQDPNYKTTDEENLLISAYFREEVGMHRDDDRLRFDFLDAKAPRKVEYAKRMDRDEFITTIYGMIAMHRMFSEHGRDYLPHGPGHQCHNYDLDIAYHEAVLKNLRKRAIANGYDENGNYDEDYEDE